MKSGFRISALINLATFSLVPLVPEVRADEPLWTEILGTPKGAVPVLPQSDEAISWRSDFSAALAEARESNRPLLVTWRCLPCEQCSEFDKEVLEGGSDLDPLLRQFVTVRLTDAALLDERYFPYRTHQDLDLSWWAYFLSPEGSLYGVFGGKDHVSDATRISKDAFIHTLERILAHHYDPRRKGWDIDRPPGGAATTTSSPKDTRGYELLLEKRPGLENPHPQFGSCLHCHQVGDMLHLEALDAGTFTVEELTGKWPLPENVGIVLDRDDGLLVTSVVPASPAARAGLQAGDKLGMANGTKLFGQADFRGALHRAPAGSGPIALAWVRNGTVQFGNLEVEPGWRVTENSWRKTIYDGVYGPGMGFFPLKGPDAGKGRGLSIKPWMGRSASDRPIYQTGLRPNMEITAINGMNQDMEIRKLITWFRLNHQPGDEVTYTVKGGKEFRYILPKE